MDKLENGLKWISGILTSHNIPYQITGGLAAHAYGATRPINDIDIDIPEDRFAEILEEVRPYLTYGPERHTENVWDVYLMTLDHEGQEIDIGGANDTRVKDEKTGVWHAVTADLTAVERKTICGVDVPVVKKTDLIEYKSWLALPGDHQERDVKEMLGPGSI